MRELVVQGISFINFFYLFFFYFNDFHLLIYLLVSGLNIFLFLMLFLYIHFFNLIFRNILFLFWNFLFILFLILFFNFIFFYNYLLIFLKNRSKLYFMFILHWHLFRFDNIFLLFHDRYFDLWLLEYLCKFLFLFLNLCNIWLLFVNIIIYTFNFICIEKLLNYGIISIRTNIFNLVHFPLALFIYDNLILRF